MKLSFTPPQDGKMHSYCIACTQESVQTVLYKGREFFDCSNCHQRQERALIIDPAVHWWTDKDGEYCHQVAGVFLHNEQQEFLFFERTKAPFGLTIPAGHQEPGEKPRQTAVRELLEETGVRANQLRSLGRLQLADDKCYRGADVHVWHVFSAAIPRTTALTLEPGSVNPVWLPLSQVCQDAVVPAVWQLTARLATALRA